MHKANWFFLFQNISFTVISFAETLELITKIVTVSASVYSFYYLHETRKADRRESNRIIMEMEQKKQKEKEMEI